MKKRGAYFFVIDAVMAGAIIFATLFFIFSTHAIKPDREPTLRSAEDFLGYIGSTKIREYQSSLVTNMTADGNITNLDNTLLDQMVNFYYNQKNGSLHQLTGEIAARTISAERGVRVYINDELAYNGSRHNLANEMNDSRLVLGAKRMSFHRLNWTSISGPIWVEVKVWV